MTQNKYKKRTKNDKKTEFYIFINMKEKSKTSKNPRKMKKIKGMSKVNLPLRQ